MSFIAATRASRFALLVYTLSAGEEKILKVIDALSKYNFNMDFQQIKITEKTIVFNKYN
ncbi:hypothetical protein HMPREF1221_00945 [Treponema socranskii subsp. paredis ATCC 35535]|nr:hypothetical protein HMPREF1221_00945 [Treponema socranskii subsp. paredis ATCC 35535]